MSWLTKIQNIKIEIVTGDGKSYFPIFNSASDTTPTNEAVFEFVDKKGGLVLRGEIGVKQYSVELHFVGEDNIDTVNEFEKSAEDKRPWTLIHPYYGTRTVQPSALNYDRSSLNDIIFSTTLYETISDLHPGEEIDVQSDVIDSVDTVSESAIENAEQVSQSTTLRIIDKYKASAVTDEDYQNIISYGNEVLNNIDDAAAFMRYNANLLRAPAKYYDSIENRINSLIEAFNELKLASHLGNYFENSSSILLSGICEAAVLLSSDVSNAQDLPELPNDYKTRNSILSVINTISTITDEFFSLLSTNQTNGYLPNYILIRELFNTITKTIGQLFILAQDALQERNYILLEDMTVPTLHHRLYGNITDIEDFVKYNSIGINELLIVPKGREVKYFV